MSRPPRGSACRSTGTVRSRLSRARERLRGGIEHRGLALPVSVAVVLASGKASAALPSDLVASTVNLATHRARWADSGRHGLPVDNRSRIRQKRAQGAHGLLRRDESGPAMAVAGVGLTGIALECRSPGSRSLHARAGRTSGSGPRAGAATLPTSVARDRERRRREAEQLQGRWRISEAAQFGEPLNRVVGDHLVIEGDRFIWTAARGELGAPIHFRRGTTRGKIAVDMDADDQRIVLIESSWELPAGPASPASTRWTLRRSTQFNPAECFRPSTGSRVMGPAQAVRGDPRRSEGLVPSRASGFAQQLLIVLGPPRVRDGGGVSRTRSRLRSKESFDHDAYCDDPDWSVLLLPSHEVVERRGEARKPPSRRSTFRCASGSWSEPETWEGGRVPARGEGPGPHGSYGQLRRGFRPDGPLDPRGRYAPLRPGPRYPAQQFSTSRSPVIQIIICCRICQCFLINR